MLVIFHPFTTRTALMSSPRVSLSPSAAVVLDKTSAGPALTPFLEYPVVFVNFPARGFRQRASAGLWVIVDFDVADLEVDAGKIVSLLMSVVYVLVADHVFRLRAIADVVVYGAVVAHIGGIVLSVSC